MKISSLAEHGPDPKLGFIRRINYAFKEVNPHHSLQAGNQFTRKRIPAKARIPWLGANA